MAIRYPNHGVARLPDGREGVIVSFRMKKGPGCYAQKVIKVSVPSGRFGLKLTAGGEVSYPVMEDVEALASECLVWSDQLSS